MSCGGKCGIRVEWSWVRLRLRNWICSIGNYFDPCTGVVGEYALGGCVSYVVTFPAEDCEQVIGEYSLAGCVSYVAVQPGGGGGDIGVGTTDIGDNSGDIG